MAWSTRRLDYWAGRMGRDLKRLEEAHGRRVTWMWTWAGRRYGMARRDCYRVREHLWKVHHQIVVTKRRRWTRAGWRGLAGTVHTKGVYHSKWNQPCQREDPRSPSSRLVSSLCTTGHSKPGTGCGVHEGPLWRCRLAGLHPPPAG